MKLNLSLTPTDARDKAIDDYAAQLLQARLTAKRAERLIRDLRARVRKLEAQLPKVTRK